MKDRTRSAVSFVLAILVIIGFAVAFNSNNKANKNRKAFEKEMAFRLDMEEKVSKLRNDKMELTTQLKTKDVEIQKKDQLLADLNKTVSQQQETIETLQLELKGMTLLKNELEDDLKAESAKREQ